MRRMLSLLSIAWFAAACATVPPRPIPKPTPVPIETRHFENLGIASEAGVPIDFATAKIVADAGPVFEAVKDQANAGRYQFTVPDSVTGGCWLHVWAEGFHESAQRCMLRFAGDEGGATGEVKIVACYDCEAAPGSVTLKPVLKRVPMVNREPLPPMPIGFNGYNPNLLSVFPEPPPREGCDFIRANMFSVEIPGLPYVRGANTHVPERSLSWLIGRYGPEWFERFMFAHQERGLRHYATSVQDSLAAPGQDGGTIPPGDGMTLDQYVEQARRIKHDYGFCGISFLLSKHWTTNSREATAQDYIDVAKPYVDALIAADAVDILVGAWESDLFMRDGPPIIGYYQWLRDYAHARGKKVAIHFSTEKTSWFRDQDPRGRFGFWDDIRGVDYLFYQADPGWSAEDLQGHIADTLWQAASRSVGGHGQPWVNLVAYELEAMDQWNGVRPNEYDGDLTCVVAMATKVPGVRVGGYGNGCRWIDGSPF